MLRAAVTASARRSALSSRRVASSSSAARRCSSLRLTATTIGPRAGAPIGTMRARRVTCAGASHLARRKLAALNGT